MKRAIPLFILISGFFSACGNPQSIPTSAIMPLPTSTSTSTPIENTDNWSEAKLLLDHIHSGKEISPNGQWIIDGYYVLPATNSNKIISTSNPKQTIEFTFSLPNPTPQRYVFDSWSPDSNEFAGIFFGETTSGWDYCCGQSVAISSINNGMPQSYIFTWGWIEKPDIYWSWDSSTIALAFRDNGLWILDRQGNLIKQIPLNNISNLIWSKDSIYAITYSRNQQYDRYDWNLYKINPTNNSAEKIYTFKDYADIIGFDENSNQLLVTLLYPPTKLLLFSLVTNEIVKEIDLPSRTHDLRVSPLSQYVAISTEENSLWIFDLTKQSPKYYGNIANDEYRKINKLLGWFSNINGFLVRTENGDFKIIQP